MRPIALIMAATLLATGPALAIGAPASAASPSWKTAHTVEFTGSSLPSGCGPYSGPYKGGKSSWSAKDATVSKGLLNLKIEKRKVDDRAWATGGVGCWDWKQKYGKWEIRAKIPSGKGIDSYFGLWPVKGGEGAWTGVEILAPGAETAYITNGYGTKAETARVPGAYTDDFHTYVIEWAPKYLRITMDGKELYFSTRSFNGQRWPGFVVSNGDALTGVPDATTKLPATFQIDRLKTYSWTGVQPTLRSQSTSAARVAGTPTPVPTVAPSSAVKAPAARPVPASAETTSPAPALSGGIWPWLLGGSLIAGAAIALLEFPRYRAHQRAARQERERHPTGAGRR